MSSAKASVDVNVPPNEIWQLIGGFGSLPDCCQVFHKVSSPTEGVSATFMIDQDTAGRDSR